MRRAEFGIVFVVIVVRTTPDTAGTQAHHADAPHDPLCHARTRQDGMVLLIVIDDEQAQHQQAFQHHAGEPNADVEIQEGSHKGSD